MIFRLKEFIKQINNIWMQLSLYNSGADYDIRYAFISISSYIFLLTVKRKKQASLSQSHSSSTWNYFHLYFSFHMYSKNKSGKKSVSYIISTFISNYFLLLFIFNTKQNYFKLSIKAQHWNSMLLSNIRKRNTLFFLLSVHVDK